MHGRTIAVLYYHQVGVYDSHFEETMNTCIIDCCTCDERLLGVMVWEFVLHYMSRFLLHVCDF